MPALSTVTFTATHTDATPPVYNGNGVWTLYTPLSPEATNAGASTTVDLHQTITAPADTAYIIAPLDDDDVPGAPYCYVVGGGFDADGTAQALSINIANVSVSNQTPTAEVAFAYLVLLPKIDYTLTQS